MKKISFGTAIDSYFYEENGETYYKMFPITGYTADVWIDEKVSQIEVMSLTEADLTIKYGLYKVKLSFKPYMANLEKITITPYFLFFPTARYYGLISVPDKAIRLKTFSRYVCLAG